MRFNIDNYKGKYVMHCKTEAEATKFCNYLHSIGRTWCSGDRYTEMSHYDDYGSLTAYLFDDGEYADVDYYISCRYTILEFSDFDWEFTKADLKTGDIVLRRNGNVEIANCELEMFTSASGWNDFDELLDSLRSRSNQKWDVIAVRRPQHKGDCSFFAFADNLGTLVYERKEPEEMTLDQVCKLLGKEIKIIK